MSKVRDSGWSVFGEVAVDSGLIALVDPMHEVDLEDYMDRDGLVTPITIDGDVTVGVMISPGLGDGSYYVEGRIEEVEGLGPRVAEIRIKFLPHPVVGYELPR